MSQRNVDRKSHIGTLIHATMREEDLIPAFTDELERLDSEDQYETLIQEARELIEKEGYGTDESGYLLNEELFDALNDFAPPFCYFGSHEGNGSDYGFWPNLESLKDDDDVRKVSDLSEVEDPPMVAVTNDHGSLTLYKPVVTYEEVWSIV